MSSQPSLLCKFLLCTFHCYVLLNKVSCLCRMYFINYLKCSNCLTAMFKSFLWTELFTIIQRFFFSQHCALVVIVVFPYGNGMQFPFYSTFGIVEKKLLLTLSFILVLILAKTYNSFNRANFEYSSPSEPAAEMVEHYLEPSNERIRIIRDRKSSSEEKLWTPSLFLLDKLKQSPMRLGRENWRLSPIYLLHHIPFTT